MVIIANLFLKAHWLLLAVKWALMQFAFSRQDCQQSAALLDGRVVWGVVSVFTPGNMHLCFGSGIAAVKKLISATV